MIVKNLSKKFGSRLLFSDLSFQIDKGLFELKGKSGCGKSTFINILLGKVSQDEGEIIFNNHENLNFSICAQDSTLFEDYSLKENLKIFKRDKNIYELLDILNFNKFYDKKIKFLSGGERKKAEIIFCCCKDADLYIFDEPFAGLDKESIIKVKEIIKDLKKNKLVILVNNLNVENFEFSNLIYFFKENGNTLIYENFSKNENIIDLNLSEKRNLKIKYSFLKFLKCFFVSNIFDYVLKMFLSTLTLVLFSLTIATGVYDSPENELSIVLNKDPFQYQRYTVNETYNSPINNKFFEENYDQNEFLFIRIKNDETINDVLVLEDNSLINDGLFYNNFNENTYATKNVINIKNLSLNGLSYNIKNENILNNYKKIDYLLQSYKDLHFSDKIFSDFYNTNGLSLLFVSEKCFDDILLFSPKELIINNDINIKSNYIFNDEILSYISKIKVIDNNTKKYFFSAKNKNIGETITLKTQFNKSSFLFENIKTTANHEDNDYLYTMNLTQFKDFLIHVCSKTQRENIRNVYPYGFSLNKSDYNKIKNYAEFEVDNVINVSKIDNTYLYLYLGLFIISFTSYFIYSLFSYKHNKEKYLRFAGVLLNNGINKRQIFNLNMFASLLLFIPSIVLSIISYVGIIIPIYNSQVIDLTFYDMTLINNLDFDYYSINNIPSNFIHFQNMFLLILIIIVLFVFIQISYNKKITKKN